MRKVIAHRFVLVLITSQMFTVLAAHADTTAVPAGVLTGARNPPARQLEGSWLNHPARAPPPQKGRDTVCDPSAVCKRSRRPPDVASDSTRARSVLYSDASDSSVTGGIRLAQLDAVRIAASPPAVSVEVPEASRDQLNPVIVTAQRRSEDLQSVPVAITAATAPELLNEGVTDTASLSLAVPGLSYTLGGNGSTPFIRGVGSTIDSVGNEASVATYVDGVYISSINASLFDFNNIDRIEVLKGPQGTLFGRNATGGVIQIITKDPSLTPSADVQVGYGNCNTTTGSFYGTTGLGETVAVDLAAYGNNQADGWGTDLVTGQPTFTRHDVGGRSKFLWTPSDDTRIVIAADYSRARNEDGLGYHVVPPGLGIDGVTRFTGFYNNDDDPNDHNDVRQSGLSIRVEQTLAVARLVNIASWRDVNAYVSLDQDATPLEDVNAQYRQHDKTITEEAHLLSKDGASLSWIVGFYYFDDLSAYDPLNVLGLTAAPLDAIQISSIQRSNSYATFGQVTPEIATDTHLTLGARYTRDARAVTGATIGLLTRETLPLAADSQSASWSKPTWRVALDHRFTSSIMGYISDDRGFKSGVYNLVTYAQAPVNPEILDAYQLGVKSEFADRRVRLNAAMFYYNYKNIQVQEVVTGAIALVNAAAAQIEGIDVDFAVLPIDALTFRGGFEILNSHYTNFENAPFFSPTPGLNGELVGGNTQSVGNATGYDTVRSPKVTATAGASYRVKAFNGDLNFNLSNYYNSGFTWDPDGRLRQSSYDVVNTSLEWSATENVWGLRIWVKNLTGTQYCTEEIEQTLLDSCVPAPPRLLGITLRAHF